MARIIGCVTTSHVPAIGKAMAASQQEAPYWKPFFDGFPPIRDWLARERPDAVVVIYNDHGLNFFLDKMPTFAIGAAERYVNADEGWGIPTLAPFAGDQDLSWQLIEHLIGADFDLTTCQEMQVDHAFTLPMKLLWPEGDAPPAVPLCINTVQFPLPGARRVWALGRALGEAIRAWDSDKRVLVLGSGGLSHQLDGRRAGFINKDFDQRFMRSLLEQPDWATRYSIHELVELTGTQGVELLMWLAARAALGDGARLVHQHYHIPISNTAAGAMALAAA